MDFLIAMEMFDVIRKLMIKNNKLIEKPFHVIYLKLGTKPLARTSFIRITVVVFVSIFIKSNTVII